MDEWLVNLLAEQGLSDLYEDDNIEDGLGNVMLLDEDFDAGEEYGFGFNG